MCVIFIAYHRHSVYPLVLLANRDEFYERPTAQAARWEDRPEIFAGRDLVAGGTWLGVTDQGRFGAITNYRDPRAPLGKISRGKLVSDFLTSSPPTPPADYIRRVAALACDFSGFNLIVGELNDTTDEIYCFSNRGAGVSRLHPGIHGISNHLLNTPWPKVTRGLEKFKELLAHDPLSIASCFDLLADETVATEELLPDTGIGAERERILSPIFVRTSDYGTRCSTVMTVDGDFKVDFREHVFI